MNKDIKELLKETIELVDVYKRLASWIIENEKSDKFDQNAAVLERLTADLGRSMTVISMADFHNIKVEQLKLG